MFVEMALPRQRVCTPPFYCVSRAALYVFYNYKMETAWLFLRYIAGSLIDRSSKLPAAFRFISTPLSLLLPLPSGERSLLQDDWPPGLGWDFCRNKCHFMSLCLKMVYYFLVSFVTFSYSNSVTIILYYEPYNTQHTVHDIYFTK